MRIRITIEEVRGFQSSPERVSYNASPLLRHEAAASPLEELIG